MKTLTLEEVVAAAQTLFLAERDARAIERITATVGDFGIEDAYRIQLQGMKLRLSEKVKTSQVGWKMGLTSESKRKQMSLDSSIFGYLLSHTWEKGSAVSLQGMIHPKAEPEVAFRLNKSLRGRVDKKTLQEAIGSYCAAIEIIDSRYVGFKYFSLPDVIADNCSSGKFLLGRELPYAPSLNLADLSMKFYVSGDKVGEAKASEISGDPINSLLQLTEMLNEFDLEIPADSIVLAGAATPAVALENGQEISLEVEGCDTLKFTV